MQHATTLCTNGLLISNVSLFSYLPIVKPNVSIYVQQAIRASLPARRIIIITVELKFRKRYTNTI
jgi:hypothetical protein